jgi:hypothetical protein
MSEAGLESFEAYQKARATSDSHYQRRMSVIARVELADHFSRPFGTWGSSLNAPPSLKAGALFDCPSGTGQGTGIFSALYHTLDHPLHEPSIKHAAPTELDNGLLCAGDYRHGAPTELEDGQVWGGGYKDDAPTELFNMRASWAKEKETAHD